MESQLIEEFAERLSAVDGVRAIVLGGSRARGTGHASSDVDIGVYYESEDELDLQALEAFAGRIDDRGRAGLVTRPGEWGPWINGGGWLTVHSVPVDILYRDLDRVRKVMDDCVEGRITIDYQPGHPHGFANHMYVAENALCRPLWDPHGCVGALKSRAIPYPAKMREGIFAKFRWEAGFALTAARKAAYRSDVSYAAGCCFRAVSCLVQTLFAANRQYWMNEKGAVELIDGFAVRPADFRCRVNRAFTLLSTDSEAIAAAVSLLETLADETELLCAGTE